MNRPGRPSVRIRVVVADDEALVRGGLRAIAELKGDIEVIAKGASDQAVALARQLRGRDPMDVPTPGPERYPGDPAAAGRA